MHFDFYIILTFVTRVILPDLLCENLVINKVVMHHFYDILKIVTTRKNI